MSTAVGIVVCGVASAAGAGLCWVSGCIGVDARERGGELKCVQCVSSLCASVHVQKSVLGSMNRRRWPVVSITFFLQKCCIQKKSQVFMASASASWTSCVRNNTVVATVLASDMPSSLLPLAESAARFGFPCIVVQPFAQVSTTTPLLFVLNPPNPPLLPRSRWCNSSGAFLSRRIELHRMRMWSALAAEGVHVLGLDPLRRLQRDPLPALAAMRTRAGAVPDVLGHTPGWFAKHFYLSSPFYVRSTNATRSLLRAATLRVRGAHEDVVFSEELNFGAGHEATCCHTECLGKYLATAVSPSHRVRSAPASPSAPPMPMLDVDTRIETSPGVTRHRPNGAQCRAMGLEYDDTPPHAPLPPNSTANRWPRDLANGDIATFGSRRYGTTAKGLPLMQLAWRADAFNMLHVPLHRFGRCTGRTESCMGLHPSCPPPPPPFTGVVSKKAGGRTKKRPQRSKKPAL